VCNRMTTETEDTTTAHVLENFIYKWVILLKTRSE